MLVIILSPIMELQHTPLLVQNAMNQGACPDFLLFRCFLFGLTFESLKELGARQVCDYDKFFWNVFASQLSGVGNGGSFKLSILYREFKF
jgi:hypothetical protein